ncbi:MAG TPA: PAS domain-containing protein [Thermoflexia bacterium]|nr:PAS domain-containing protein [Thermoflexia bacterium]
MKPLTNIKTKLTELTDQLRALSPGRRALLLLLLTSWVLMLVLYVVAWQEYHTPFPGFTVEPNGLLTPFGRSCWARYQLEEPLQILHRLVSVDGIPIPSNRALFHLLRDEYAVGEEAFFTFELPDGTERTVLFPLVPWPALDFIEIFLVPYLVGLILLGLGTWVFWSRDDTASAIFTVFSCTLTLSLSTIYDLTGSGLLPHIWIAAISLNGAIIIQLGLLFPLPLRWLHERPKIQYLPYIPALLLLIAGELTLYTWPTPWTMVTVWRLIYALNIAGIFFFLALQWRRMRHPPSITTRRQSRIILMGAAIAFGPGAFWFLTNLVGSPAAFSGIFSAPVLFFPLATAYAILRHRLTAVDRLLSRGVTYGSLSLVIVAAFFELTHILANALGEYLTNPFFLSVFVMLLVLIFNPLRVLVQRLIDSFFLRTKPEEHHSIRVLNQKIAPLLELAPILTTIGRQLAEHQITHATLWLYNEVARGYTPYVLEEEQPATAGLWRKDHGLVRTIESYQTAFFIQQAPYNGSVCVPLHYHQGLIGWFLLLERQTPYSAAELEYLTALAESCTPTLDRARRYTYQRERAMLLTAAFSNIPCGVITLDRQGKIIVINTTAEKLLNITASEVLGEYYLPTLTPLHSSLNQQLKIAQAENRPVRLETRLLLADQETLPLHLHISPLYNNSGEIKGNTITLAPI